jgi:two-component system nitrogen regulation response regulator GlnG/two-component system response regulator HydG
MPDFATIDAPDLPWTGARVAPRGGLELVLAWSLAEPGRVGEAAPVPGPLVLGRGDGDGPRAALRPWRPLGHPPGRPLLSPHISRDQLRVSPDGAGALLIENIGKTKLLVNGQPASAARVVPGDTLQLRNAVLLLVVDRPAWTGPAPAADFAFGGPDAHGIIGEGHAAWRLRAQLHFAAQGDQHVLLLGPSGAGKELAARAVHALSARGRRPLVSRNAATLPEGLVDAELFGNIRNYPNPGTPERAGLIGEADGSSLFLDEIGELPPALQAHLLRVLDRGGEFQRLGDPRPRRADLRLIAATNRPVGALKADFAARLPARVEVPGLEARREDVPLLLRAALAGAAPALRARFCEADGAPRLHPDLVDALLRHRYRLHARELHRLLWLAAGSSPGAFLALTPEVEAELDLDAEAPAGPAAPPPDKAAVEAALAAAGGRVAAAADALGLPSRYALYRLMKKLGVADPAGDAAAIKG